MTPRSPGATPATPATSARERYVAAIRTAACAELGRALAAGTTVVAAAARAGSTAAVAYPLGDRTVVWCAPALRTRIASLNGPTALSHDGFLAATAELGGAHIGSGHNRVLPAAAPRPAVEAKRLVTLDRDRAPDRALVAAFIAGCSDEDLDEAELDIDELDAAIVAVLADDGTIASYASARPWAFDPAFDDIGVITHPQHRGHHFGASAVSFLSQQQQRQGRLMFYNCNVDNVGSNRVAEAAGFELVNTIAAASFD